MPADWVVDRASERAVQEIARMAPTLSKKAYGQTSRDSQHVSEPQMQAHYAAHFLEPGFFEQRLQDEGPEAVIRRLEAMGVLPVGTWKQLERESRE